MQNVFGTGRPFFRNRVCSTDNRLATTTSDITTSKSAFCSICPHYWTFPPVSVLNIDGVEQVFLKNCLSHVVNARTQAGIRSPLSSSSTLDQTRLTKNYSDAYTDTHGLFSRAPFIFKTGAAWPKAMDGPNAQPFLREMRPISNHPILSAWDGILTDAGAYLKGVGNTFNAVMAPGFANWRENGILPTGGHSRGGARDYRV